MRHFSSILLLCFWLSGCSTTPLDVVIRGQLLFESSSEPVADHAVLISELRSARSAGGTGILDYFLGTFVGIAETQSDESGQFEIRVAVRSAIGVGYRICNFDFGALYVIEREEYRRQPEQWVILRIPEDLDCNRNEE